MSRAFGWVEVVRLGLVQASIGAVVVIAMSTLNRVMQVEYGLPALVPGVLVAMHYLVQIARPRMGHGSDRGARRTPWILVGMAALACGGILAAAGTACLGRDRGTGLVLAVLGFACIGIGVSAAGTSSLALLARRVEAPRRAAAATTVWLMMILGFALTSAIVGKLLDPYSATRLVAVTAGVGLVACALTALATLGLEGANASGSGMPPPAVAGVSFRQALAEVWGDAAARLFTQFVFLSMLAYSAQELLLEPFAGAALGYTPGESAGLTGLQHAGALVGMLAATLAGRGPNGRRYGSLRDWQVAGCIGSAAMLAALACAAEFPAAWPLRANVFALGVANGAFSIAAIASMMRLASLGAQARVGLRMGLWGAAQAVAFGFGGLFGTACSDLARWLVGTPGSAYAAVFAVQALLFVASAVLAVQLGRATARAAQPAPRVQPVASARLAL